MKNLTKLLFLVLLIFVFQNTLFSQEKPEPIILSIMPDSLFIKYDYFQTVFLIGSNAGSFKLSGTPTEKALEELKKKIIALCKSNNADGFIISQLIYAKPAEVVEIICHGTLIKKKSVLQVQSE